MSKKYLTQVFESILNNNAEEATKLFKLYIQSKSRKIMEDDKTSIEDKKDNENEEADADSETEEESVKESRLISRDPFAREELHRTAVRTDSGCTNCGSSRQTPKGKKYLYKYHTETDSINGRKNEHNGKFCGKSCHDSYHS